MDEDNLIPGSSEEITSRPVWARNLPVHEEGSACALDGTDLAKMLSHNWRTCNPCYMEHYRKKYGENGYYSDSEADHSDSDTTEENADLEWPEVTSLNSVDSSLLNSSEPTKKGKTDTRFAGSTNSGAKLEPKKGQKKGWAEKREESMGRYIAKDQQNFLPFEKYDNDKLISVLTRDQHKLYIARNQHFQRTGGFFEKKGDLSEYQDALLWKRTQIPKNAEYDLTRGNNFIELPETDAGQTQNDSVWLELEKVLLEVGKYSKIVLPDIERRAVVPVNYEAVAKKFPAKNKQTHLGIENDPNIVTLLRKYNPKLITTASSLRLLLAQHDMSRGTEWDVPVTVRHEISLGGDSSMDDSMELFGGAVDMDEVENFGVRNSPTKNLPLPSTSDTAEPSAAAPVVKRKRGRPPKKSPQKLTAVEEKETTVADDVRMTRSRKKGTVLEQDNKPSVIEMSEESTVKGGQQSKETVRGEQNVKVKVRESAEREKGVVGERKGSISVLDSIFEGMEKKPAASTATKLSGRTDSADEDMDIQVRSKCDGRFGRRLKGKVKSAALLHASILPKLEYLYEHGGQVFSDSEWIHNWATAVLKCSDTHIVGRIACDRNDVLRFQEMQPGDFRKEKLPTEKRHLLESHMWNVMNILKSVTELANGEYLLRCRPGEKKIQILNSSIGQTSPGNRQVISVADLYSDRRLMSDVPLPADLKELYLPIDPDVVFQYHKIKKRIPATFLPRQDDNVEPNLKWEFKEETKQSIEKNAKNSRTKNQGGWRKTGIKYRKRKHKK